MSNQFVIQAIAAPASSLQKHVHKLRETWIYGQAGNFLALFPPQVRQPRHGQKQVMYNCSPIALTWAPK